MASYNDLLDAIARVRSVTGDPDAWTKGLTGADVTTVCNPASPPAALGAVLAKVTAAHPEVFLADSPAGAAAAPPRIGEGAAADTIREAEASLAHQNTDAAHVDLQVVTAVLNAHAVHDDGLAELVALQRNIEDAVMARTDLDTPAGAWEFQRFLNRKLRDIRNVVENSSLDATSKASLAAALATLYASSTPESHDRTEVGEQPSDSESPPRESEHHRRGPAESASSATVDAPPRAWNLDPGAIPWLDSLEPLPPEAPALDQVLSGPPAGPPLAPPAPPVSAVPAPVMASPAPAGPVWGAGLPGGAAFGGGLPAMASPLSPAPLSPAPALPQLPTRDLANSVTGGRDRAEAAPIPEPDPVDRATETSEDQPDEIAPGDPDSTTVNPPDGDTVTAPSPEVAAAITAAVGGTPIPDAFRSQGIVVPAPGSVVTAPLDPASLAPGDIGVFTDRLALALGGGKALVDAQIQPIAGVSGPGFLGWQHPPEPEPVDYTPDLPAPNRVAATAPS